MPPPPPLPFPFPFRSLSLCVIYFLIFFSASIHSIFPSCCHRRRASLPQTSPPPLYQHVMINFIWLHWAIMAIIIIRESYDFSFIVLAYVNHSTLPPARTQLTQSHTYQSSSCCVIVRPFLYKCRTLMKNVIVIHHLVFVFMRIRLRLAVNISMMERRERDNGADKCCGSISFIDGNWVKCQHVAIIPNCRPFMRRFPPLCARSLAPIDATFFLFCWRSWIMCLHF